MPERRQEHRRKVLRYAVATSEHPHHRVRCVVKDLSEGGVQLVGEHVDGFEADFTLEADCFARPVRCRAIWRRHHALGAKFLEAPVLLEDLTHVRPDAVAPGTAPRQGALILD
ncbi:PilZ domain-containing protein [Prosthecomicrobium sp. N25]|uniref:PilZ domain-containing protein n=1 Tax=Prosthecomicrobium sp. N25 TaxID=3129254 RepID=UPI0030770349